MLTVVFPLSKRIGARLNRILCRIGARLNRILGRDKKWSHTCVLEFFDITVFKNKKSKDGVFAKRISVQKNAHILDVDRLWVL